MTHALGFDFNSIYPSSFSSNQHKFIPYTDNKLLMAGKITNSFFTENKQLKDLAMDLINNGRDQTEYVFIASVKGHIPEDRINDCVNFPPIMRNLEIKTDKETIGAYMYNYLKSCDLTTDKKERKLTNLLSTHGEYMAFSNYYLWFLIDQFDFVIEDINYFIKFDAHDRFNNFVNHFMNKRIDFMNEGNKGGETFCKLILNGSYGYDIMNEEHFNEVKLTDANDCLNTHMLHTYRSERKLTDDLYQVNLAKKKYNCDTPIQEGFFTLDNAKYWYLNFMYRFMFKAYDTERFHFIEGDTDSMYWAVAGDPTKPITQDFDEIIKNRKFYDKNVHEFLPDNSIESSI